MKLARIYEHRNTSSTERDRKTRTGNCSRIPVEHECKEETQNGVSGVHAVVISSEASRIVRVRFRLLRVNTESRYDQNDRRWCAYILSPRALES
jgi:hypothetical protein